MPNGKKVNEITITGCTVRVLADNADSKVKAYVTVVLNDSIRLRGIKIVEGAKGPFIGYPSYLRQDGQFQEIYVPTDKNLRSYIREAALEEYALQLEKAAVPA